jgi:hypothetical protein
MWDYPMMAMGYSLDDLMHHLLADVQRLAGAVDSDLDFELWVRDHHLLRLEVELAFDGGQRELIKTGIDNRFAVHLDVVVLDDLSQCVPFESDRLTVGVP